MTEGDKPLKVAVLGCGVVGSQVVRLLHEQADDLAARIGAPVELAGVAVRRLDAPRDVEVPDGLLTTDAEGLVRRADVDLVVEVIGGIDPAKDLVLAALKAGKPVVTANKELMAAYGAELFDVLGAFDLDFALHAAENQGYSKVVSAPRVTTQDNQAATITSGFQIPYQTRINFTTTVDYGTSDTPTATQLEGSQGENVSIRPGLRVPLRTGGEIRLDAPLRVGIAPEGGSQLRALVLERLVQH